MILEAVHDLAGLGVKIHIHPTAGGWQVSVASGHTTNSWTIVTGSDLEDALSRALSQRIAVSVALGNPPPPPPLVAETADIEDWI